MIQYNILYIQFTTAKSIRFGTPKTMILQSKKTKQQATSQTKTFGRFGSLAPHWYKFARKVKKVKEIN